MIPPELLNPASIQPLMIYLREEITRALSERKPAEERWLKFERAYRQRPDRELKEFPFVGAANLVLPVIATDVDTIYSRIMGIIFEPENLWSAKPLRPDAIEYAPRLQEFLEWAQHNEVEAYEAVSGAVRDMCLLGTGVTKERYRREQQLVYEFRESDQGTLDQQRQVMIHDGPQMRHVSVYNFLFPASATNLRESPWVAERIYLTWGQLQDRVAAGIYQGSERLAAQRPTDRGSEPMREMQNLDRFVPGLGTQYEVWEVWLRYAIGPQGSPPVEIVCTVHLPTMTYLRIDFNPFFHQEKPFSVMRYLAQPDRILGIGLGDMLEGFQDEVTTMHNQRIDNATLANTTMMKGRKGSGIKEDEPIFPGRWFLVDDMADVETMNIGQKYDSTVGNEELAMSYARARTGVNDYISGASSASVGYATAATNVMQHQEAAKRFDQTLREVRRALGDAGRRIVELYQQFNQQGKEYMVLGDAEGEIVHQVLQFPLELIRHSVSIEVTATNATLNKEVAIRTNSMIAQQITQYYTQVLQALQLVVNPQIPEPMRAVAMQAIQAGSVIMRRLLDSYQVQDIDDIVPRIGNLLGGAQQPPAQIGAGPAPGAPGAQQPPGAMGFGGMGGLPPGA